MTKAHTDRRTLLGTIAAVPMVALANTAGASTSPTPILSLFKQWTQLNSDAHGVSEEVCNAAVDQMAVVERQIAKEPVTCTADYAAKILVVTSYGVFGLSGEQSGEDVLAEAKALVASA